MSGKFYFTKKEEAFRRDFIESSLDAEVAINRRDFLGKFNILGTVKSWFPGCGTLGRDYLDHPLFLYRWNDGYELVLVVSNYDAVPPAHYCMEEIPSIYGYGSGSRSFVVVYPSRAIAKREIESAQWIDSRLKI
jgi:hypothetical protein